MKNVEVNSNVLEYPVWVFFFLEGETLVTRVNQKDEFKCKTKATGLIGRSSSALVDWLVGSPVGFVHWRFWPFRLKPSRFAFPLPVEARLRWTHLKAGLADVCERLSWRPETF